MRVSVIFFLAQQNQMHMARRRGPATQFMRPGERATTGPAMAQPHFHSWTPKQNNRAAGSEKVTRKSLNQRLVNLSSPCSKFIFSCQKLLYFCLMSTFCGSIPLILICRLSVELDCTETYILYVFSDMLTYTCMYIYVHECRFMYCVVFTALYKCTCFIWMELKHCTMLFR